MCPLCALHWRPTRSCSTAPGEAGPHPGQPQKYTSDVSHRPRGWPCFEFDLTNLVDHREGLLAGVCELSDDAYWGARPKSGALSHECATLPSHDARIELALERCEVSVCQAYCPSRCC